MIRTLIIEDETPAAIRLEKMLRELSPEIQVLDILDSVSGAKRWLDENEDPDLLMLDIQLADGISFDIFSQRKTSSFVIFTTAYDAYAIRAFELNSVDYLLKPIDRAKLEKAIQKFRDLRKRQTGMDISSLMKALEAARKQFKERFVVNAGSSIRSIETPSIAYFYSLEKSNFLCTLEGRHYPVDHSLDRLEEMLDPDQFFRINRKNLVRFSAIERIQVLSRSRVALHLKTRTDEPLLVSTGRTHAFRLWLDR